LGACVFGLLIAKAYVDERDVLVDALSGNMFVVVALLILFGARSFLLFLAPGLILFALVARALGWKSPRDAFHEAVISPDDASVKNHQ
jgi:hypothetical protein